jgi:hypothetical protein
MRRYRLYISFLTIIVLLTAVLVLTSCDMEQPTTEWTDTYCDYVKREVWRVASKDEYAKLSYGAHCCLAGWDLAGYASFVPDY